MCVCRGVGGGVERGRGGMGWVGVEGARVCACDVCARVARVLRARVLCV